jgi:hypothetical protein
MGVSYGQFSVLFTGDAEAETEADQPGVGVKGTPSRAHPSAAIIGRARCAGYTGAARARCSL